MAKGLRNFTQEEVVNVVRRRLEFATKQGKDWKPGLGTISAMEFGPARDRRVKKAQDKEI